MGTVVADNLSADIQRFQDSLAHRSVHTQAAYKRDVADFLAFVAGQNVSQWNAVDSKLVRAYVSDQHRRGANGRSIARGLSALRSLFKFLMAEGSMSSNPAQHVKAPRSERRLPRALDVDQMAHMLAEDASRPIDIRDRAMWEMLYSAGIRVSELVGLDRSDVDLGHGQARVLGKGNKERDVPLGRYAIAALRRWYEVRVEWASADEKAVFVSQQGKRLTTRTVQLRLRQWASRQGIDINVHPHMLRHSFASHMLESSGDLRAVQELLGHANISTTQIYTHLDFQRLADVYDQTHPRARQRKRQ